MESAGCRRMSALAEASPTIPPPITTTSNELQEKVTFKVMHVYSTPHPTSHATFLSSMDN